MRIASGKIGTTLALVLAAAAAGCVSSGPGGGGPVAVASTVEGNWIDTQGTGLSTLTGGSFQTVATDTGQRLASGSYVVTGPNAIQISGTSLIRQSPISFNCILAGANQLNCTSSGGQQFTLTRRGAQA